MLTTNFAWLGRAISKVLGKLANPQMSLAATFILAIFALWDVLDVFLVGVEADLGVEHGVAGFSVIEFVRRFSEFYLDMMDADSDLSS